MTEPVHGYRATDDVVAMININKEMEERLLRFLDALSKQSPPGVVDGRWYSIARTHFDQGWLALNRAIGQPTRIKLPEDEGLPHPIPDDGS